MARARCPRCTFWHSPICPDLRRWPLTPLLDHAASLGVENVPRALGTNAATLDDLADRGLSDVLADRWAIRLGTHPAHLWSGWLDAGLSVVDRQRLAGGWRPAWLHDMTPDTKETAA